MTRYRFRLSIEDTAVTLQGFVGLDAQQADSFTASVGLTVLPVKLLGQILLVHPVFVCGHGIMLEIDDVEIIFFLEIQGQL